jgi:rubredoxin
VTDISAPALTLPIPAACPLCHASGRVGIETVMLAQLIALLWRCNNCDHSWAVRATEGDESATADYIPVH